MPDYKFTIGNYPAKRSSQLKILTGQRFGRLLVIGYAGVIKKASCWHCLCDCGNGRTIPMGNLTRQILPTRSCGCKSREVLKQCATKHGRSQHPSPEYAAYAAAKQRCNNPTHAAYHNYGKRGIEFRFKDFPDFLLAVGERPTSDHSLERIDNEGHYEIDNVEWTTRKQQMRNRRNNHLITAFNKTQCITDWQDELHISKATIRERDTRGWCGECAVSLPVNNGTCIHKT